jgi:hypothetical protein
MAQSPHDFPGARRCGRTGRDPCGLVTRRHRRARSGRQ